MNSKEISVLAGVSVGSLLAGGLFGYYLSGRKKLITSNPDNKVHKTTSEFSSDLDKYIVNNSLREPEILSELRKHTFENVNMSIMLADPVEAQLFSVILSVLNARKCIEVGVYTGYNTLNMALSIPSDGIVYALDVSADYVNHGRKFFEKAMVSEKIDVRIAPASDTLDKLIEEGQGGTFDFIFIDADKPGYDTYYEKGLVLLRQGGIIALDNMFQGGNVLSISDIPANKKGAREDAEAINKLNMKLHKDERVRLSLLKIADGVSLCEKL